MIDKNGNLIRTIRRRPDGNWLAFPHAVSLAAGGSLAILALSHSHRGEWNPPTVNLYDASGDPIRTIMLPHAVGPYPRLAYHGNRIVVVGDSGIILFDAYGTALQQFLPPEYKNPKEADWTPFLIAGTLYMFDYTSSTLHRYAMP